MNTRAFWSYFGLFRGPVFLLALGSMAFGASATVIELEAGRWDVEGVLEADEVTIGSDAVLGGGGTVNAPTTVSGALDPDGTLLFNSTVTFSGGVLLSHASDNTTLDGIAAVGAVTGTATVQMTRAETAFPTQQVVIAGSAASDYAAFVVQPSGNWVKGTSGSLSLWVTFQQNTLVVLYDFYLQEMNGEISVCWLTASEEQTVGFYLYRWNGSEWVQVNDALIPSQGSMGGSYSVADSAANATDVFRYKLVEQEKEGEQVYEFDDVSVRNPRLENISIIPEGVVLRWLSREQDTYEVQRSPNLMSPLEPIATGLPATPPVNVYTDQTESAGTAFYRIRVE